MTERLEREPTRLPSLPLLAAGLAGLAIAIVWPDRALGVVALFGAAVALAAGRWPIRLIGLGVAAAGLLAVAATL